MRWMVSFNCRIYNINKLIIYSTPTFWNAYIYKQTTIVRINNTVDF